MGAALKPEDLGKLIGIAVREALAPVKARLAELEKSVDGRGLKFMGRWNRDVTYQRGEMISYTGALWVASRPTTDAPGACSDWQRMLASDNRGGFKVGDEG